jgi:hypothetical protein
VLQRRPLQNDLGPMLSLSDPIGGHFLGAFKFVERAPGTREISQNRTRGYWTLPAQNKRQCQLAVVLCLRKYRKECG